ncbi:MAG: pyridoxamine kinase [Coriobacteriia bacterium]|nr:pyridoxamine kinase [Coriobacteriia bacterium]MCL2745578.1 pyridoxamine kinase [Coriobacteriia bacterium]MCL2870576.1 pyridoxamine kinase [Coriobacteriia bacterium]
MNTPRVLAIHDISGIGRCSLTVALPVLSAAGIECAVLPTAVLSTHTGEFEGYTFRDLTEDVLPIAQHWKSLNLKFDAIYTGYLGSFEQIELIKEVITLLADDDTLIVVDPVMADEGELYPGFTLDYPDQMRSLCALADVLVPNLTEAALLLGRDYDSSPDTDAVKDLLAALCSDIGAGSAVLTGVSLAPDSLGAAARDSKLSSTTYAGAARAEGMYHGSGDLFCSALVAGLLNGCSLEESTKLAVDFTSASIQRTYAAGAETRYGLLFEAGLAHFSAQFNTLY